MIAPDLSLIEFVDKKNYKMPPYALNKRKRGQDLSWKKVDHKFADAEGDGWMGLEEIDGVDVDFEEGHSGERLVKLRVRIYHSFAYLFLSPLRAYKTLSMYLSRKMRSQKMHRIRSQRKRNLEKS